MTNRQVAGELFIGGDGLYGAVRFAMAARAAALPVIGFPPFRFVALPMRAKRIPHFRQLRKS